MTGRPAQEGPWGRARGNDAGEGQQDQGVGPTCPHESSSPASLGQTCPLLPGCHSRVPPSLHSSQLHQNRHALRKTDLAKQSLQGGWGMGSHPSLPGMEQLQKRLQGGGHTGSSPLTPGWFSRSRHLTGDAGDLWITHFWLDHQSLGVWDSWTPGPLVSRTPEGRSMGAAGCSEWPTLCTRVLRVRSPQHSEARPPGCCVSTRVAPSAFLLPRGWSIPPGAFPGGGRHSGLGLTHRCAPALTRQPPGPRAVPTTVHYQPAALGVPWWALYAFQSRRDSGALPIRGTAPKPPRDPSCLASSLCTLPC